MPPEPGTSDEPTPDEVELATRARAGDRTAYSQLVAAHQQIAFRVAYLVTGSAPEAEDAAQEGFVKAYRSLHRFDPGRPFRPWLLTIVANEARNRRRSAGRRLAYEARAVRLAPSTPDRTPEHEAEAAETRRALLDGGEPAPRDRAPGGGVALLPRAVGGGDGGGGRRAAGHRQVTHVAGDGATPPRPRRATSMTSPSAIAALLD